MPVFTLSRSQVVHAAPDTCWAFFSNPKNLPRITPPSLDFKIQSDLPPAIHAGLMICYRVRPLLGIAVTWLTEITHVEAPFYFVDEQRVGPYRLWHHEHHFIDLGDGRTECRDLVHYVLPGGPLGALVQPIVVAPQLEAIFEFRRQTLEAIFPAPARREPAPV
jgi:ligand-binding SRPBCC domain-containing protein